MVTQEDEKMKYKIEFHFNDGTSISLAYPDRKIRDEHFKLISEEIVPKEGEHGHAYIITVDRIIYFRDITWIQKSDKKLGW